VTTPPIDDCAVIENDGPCWEAPLISRPVPLCRKHLATVVHLATEAFIRVEASDTVEQASDRGIIERAKALDIQGALLGSHPSAVYFLTNGSRIKIGYTTNLKGRVGTLALRERDVLLLLRGGAALEQALHRRFARERVHNTEWFELTPRITRFIERCALSKPSLTVKEAFHGWVPTQKAPAREKAPTAAEKILLALGACCDPGTGRVAYLHVDQLAELASVSYSTVANVCTQLVKDGKAVRGAKGEYGIPVVAAE
jgi:hypothetical protein